MEGAILFLICIVVKKQCGTCSWFLHEKLNFSSTLRSGNKYCKHLSELAKKKESRSEEFSCKKRKGGESRNVIKDFKV